MHARSRTLFVLLVFMQAAHSTEDFVFERHEVFAPARFSSGLVSDDLAFEFLVVNVSLVVFGPWCYGARVCRNVPRRRGGPGALCCSS